MKRYDSRTLNIGVILSVALHFVLFSVFPTLTADSYAYVMDEFEAIDLPPEIEIPPPPEQIQRPATPVVSEAVIDDDITMLPTTFDHIDNIDLPPPPTDTGRTGQELPAFTPFEVAPRITNQDHLRRLLERRYPSHLRDAGIGGTTQITVFVSEEGEVIEARIGETSGVEALDNIALEIVRNEIELSPALNQDRVVPVWINIPITFESR